MSDNDPAATLRALTDARYALLNYGRLHMDTFDKPNTFQRETLGRVEAALARLEAARDRRAGA